MNYQIRWTKKSADNYEDIVNFIRLHWPENIVKQFVRDSFSTIELMRSFPFMFKSVKNKNIRKGLINKHVCVYYRVSGENIELLYFWDNRMNPEDNKYKK